MSALEMKILKYGNVEAITLAGHLVLGEPVNELRQKMENLMAHGGCQFVLGMEAVSRLDSSGIGLLVLMLTSNKELGGSLKLVNPSRQVIQVLKMCSVLPLFEVFSEEEEAISSFAEV